jgi:hypothetical protein
MIRKASTMTARSDARDLRRRSLSRIAEAIYSRLFVTDAAVAQME